ncbi:MAG TPA: radical SAM protein [Polyangiales bacterium]|nr:radical SAM protein [Polyangiales bacterium]
MSDTGASSALDVIARLEAESGKPLSAMLELSDRCNEVCVHCYQVQGQKGELGTGDWRRILDQLAEAGVLLLTLSGGEVTLRKDFLVILAYARERGFVLRIFTNGLTMTQELAGQLAEHQVMEVEISLYSSRAEVHDFVTGVPGSFDKTVRGIRYLRERGVSVTIKAVMMNVNQADLPDYPAFAASLGAHYRIDTGGVVPREGCDREPQALNPERERVDQLLRQLRTEAGARTAVARAQTTGLRAASRRVCGAAQAMHVEPNGEMRPCTLLEVNLGDTRDQTPAQIFESDVARGVRGLRWGDVHGCRVCELASRCARCHAVALAETGDALAPYPSACEKARAAAQIARSMADDGGTLRFVAAGSRPIALGPYRLIAPDLYEAFDEPKKPEDDALAQRLGWVRRPEAGKHSPDLAVRPGELIQIRRPGKSSKLERVPGLGDQARK